MINIEVRRRQCAVGHGGFHTGVIRAADLTIGAPPGLASAELSYVYDCGSESPRELEGEMSAYRSSCLGRTDILFVSHLHSDHCNGIEKLQAAAAAEVVVVPYLDVIDRLMIVLSDADEGRLSTSMLQYFEDPIAWWQQRGAPKVVFLEPGRGDDPPPTIEDPDFPLDGDDAPQSGQASEKVWRKGPQTRFASHLKSPRQKVPGLVCADEQSRSVEGGATIAGAGSSFLLQWRAGTTATWSAGDWLLVPYVHPVDSRIQSRFIAALKKKLALRGALDARFFERLIDHVSNFEKRNKLVELYRSHFSSGQNALSMSLYSGPAAIGIGHEAERHVWEWRWHHETSSPLFPFWFDWPSAVGWLSTGDSALKEEVRRKPWLDFYRHFASEVGVLTLPHHGSKHNFHNDIIDFDGLMLALATTIETRERVAGLRETLASVQHSGIATQVVDQELKNAWMAKCVRELSS